MHSTLCCMAPSLAVISTESQLEAKAESVRDKESASQQSAAENYHEVQPCLLPYFFTYARLLVGN